MDARIRARRTRERFEKVILIKIYYTGASQKNLQYPRLFLISKITISVYYRRYCDIPKFCRVLYFITIRFEVSMELRQTDLPSRSRRNIVYVASAREMCIRSPTSISDISAEKRVLLFSLLALQRRARLNQVDAIYRTTLLRISCLLMQRARNTM